MRLKSLSAELSLLLLACDVRPSPAKQRRLRDWFTRSLDLEGIVDLAVAHGTAGLLYQNLRSAGCLDNLGSQAERLHRFYLLTVARNLKLIHGLGQALECFANQGVPAVVLQGAALVGSVYPQIGMRPLSDVDLWIPRRMGKAKEILTGLGYCQRPLYPDTFAKGDITFDLHSHLLWADRIRSRRWLMGIDPADVLAQARPVRIEGCQAMVLDSADQVIYLCLHALKHNLDRLIWLIDINHLVGVWTRDQWVVFWNRARRWGQTKAVSVVLELVQHLLEVDLRIGLGLAQRPVFSLPERISLRRARAKGQMPWWGAMVWLKPAGPPVRRLILMLENLFPEPAVLRQVFPSKVGLCPAVLYALRLWQLVVQVANRLNQNASADGPQPTDCAKQRRQARPLP